VVATTIDGGRDRCQACGFDPDQLAPSDAVVAARSLARRWRELLDAVVEREDDAQSLLRQRFAGGWSPLERVGHVSDVFERQAERLMRVWQQERPALDEVRSEARPASAAAAHADLLAQLDAAAERLAKVIERFDGGDWDRAGARAGQPVTAWQLVAEAVHEASHHLRACRDELSAVSAHHVDAEEEEQ